MDYYDAVDRYGHETIEQFALDFYIAFERAVFHITHKEFENACLICLTLGGPEIATKLLPAMRQFMLETWPDGSSLGAVLHSLPKFIIRYGLRPGTARPEHVIVLTEFEKELHECWNCLATDEQSRVTAKVLANFPDQHTRQSIIKDYPNAVRLAVLLEAAATFFGDKK